MTIRQHLFPPEKRELRFNKLLKNLLRLIHILVFGIVFGGSYLNAAYGHVYHLIIVLSGLLMVLRAIYKNGRWMVQVRGFLTFLKIIILPLGIIGGGSTFQVILVVSIIGILSSHSPKKIRKYELITIS